MQTFLHAQQRRTTCAVASIRTVLHRQFGLRIAEAALIALGTTPDAPIIREGSDTRAMRRMVRNASKAYNAGPPWTLRVRTKGTLRQLQYWLKRGRWPIVEVFVDDVNESHAIVVVGVSATRVRFFDPDPSAGKKLRSMNREDFLDWWSSPPNNPRWWSVVNGGDLLSHW